MASHSPEADAAPWRALFFEMLRKTGNVSAAARHAGRARAQLYRLRKQHTAFAALWDDALEEAADWLELEALRRAMDGTEEGRYFRGEMIGTITRYSDSLLMFLLKARRPLVFGTSQARRLTSANDEDSLDALRRELETKMAGLMAAHDDS
ncbi:MAG: hypothetical protein ACPHUP_01625 [Candidatus Puniceispirillaceae bacterium]